MVSNHQIFCFESNSQIFCLLDDWCQMTMDDIRKFEDEVKKELDKVCCR